MRRRHIGMGFFLITVGLIALAFTAFGAGGEMGHAMWWPFAFIGGVLKFMLGLFVMMLFFRLMAGMFFFGPMRWHRRRWGYEYGPGYGGGCGPQHHGHDSHHHEHGPQHHGHGPHDEERRYRPQGRHGHRGERWYGGPQGWGGRPGHGGWDRPPQGEPDDKPSARDVGPDGPAGMV